MRTRQLNQESSLRFTKALWKNFIPKATDKIGKAMFGFLNNENWVANIFYLFACIVTAGTLFLAHLALYGAVCLIPISLGAVASVFTLMADGVCSLFKACCSLLGGVGASGPSSDNGQNNSNYARLDGDGDHLISQQIVLNSSRSEARAAQQVSDTPHPISQTMTLGELLARLRDDNDDKFVAIADSNQKAFEALFGQAQDKPNNSTLTPTQVVTIPTAPSNEPYRALGEDSSRPVFTSQRSYPLMRQY